MKETIKDNSDVKSEIRKLRKLLEEKRNAIKNKSNPSKKGIFLNVAIIFLTIVLFSVLFINFTNKKQIVDDKDLYAFYLDQRHKDSVKLKAIVAKINQYKEKREIDSILEDIRISDSLLFENTEVAKVVFKKNPQKQNVLNQKPFKKNTNFVNQKTFSDYDNANKKTVEQKKPSKTKEEKYYTSTDKFAVYKGCERKNNEVKKRKCFNSKLNRYISKNINKKLFKEKGIKRVDVLIAITKEGYLKILKIKTALTEVLYNEIIRVLESVPRFLAAIDNNRKVGVKFNLPIRF